jgi:hypothetical protein
MKCQPQHFLRKALTPAPSHKIGSSEARACEERNFLDVQNPQRSFASKVLIVPHAGSNVGGKNRR